MKHPTSRQLHAYWDRLRGARAAPERSEIEPGEIRNLLADSLIIEIDPARGSANVRLAGTRVCALFGRELKGAAFSALWGDNAGRESGQDPRRLVEAVSADTVGLVAGLTGETAQGERLDLELLLLPLRHRGHTQARILGSLAPHFVPHWLGLRPLSGLTLQSARVLGPQALANAPGDAAALLGGMPEAANDALPFRRGHLLVHPGGRA